MIEILVTGGAGYIGSHMCRYLEKNGYQPVVLDNLSRGHKAAVRWGPFYRGAVSDGALLDHIFSTHRIALVMHFAAFAYVGESVDHPDRYYRNNTGETLFLLEKMIAHQVRRLVFSSTCAVYGEARRLPLDESHPRLPVNPYGRSKLMIEQALRDLKAAHGMEYTSLRYFNAAGADPDGTIGEDHRPETHLIPLALQTALGQREEVEILGTDYPTEDGTCVRDYIHVDDLVRAHLIAMRRLLENRDGDIYNLGTGTGYSVREIIETARRVTGRQIPVRTTPRRPGDPAVLVASSEKALRELNWQPDLSDLETILESAWNWHRSHPRGYDST
jgi:UDP-glucose 4-epimerase